jgi:hypothetical protein
MGKNYALRKKNGTTRIVQCDSNGNGGYFFKSDKQRCRGKIFTSKQKAKSALSKTKSKRSSFGRKKGDTNKLGQKLTYTVNISPDSSPMDSDAKYIVCKVRTFSLSGEKFKVAVCGSGYDKTYHRLEDDAKTWKSKKAAKKVAADVFLAGQVGTQLGEVLDPALLRQAKILTASGRLTSRKSLNVDLLDVFEGSNIGVQRAKAKQERLSQIGLYMPEMQGTTGNKYVRRDLGALFKRNPSKFADVGLRPVTQSRWAGRQNVLFNRGIRRRSSSPVEFRHLMDGSSFGMRRRRASLNKIYGGRVNYGFSRYF